MSPEANDLLSKLYKTGKHPAKNRKAAAELMDAGLAVPGKNGGLKILPAGRFAAWQAQQANKSIEKEK